jgi:hypothetical protein
MAATTYFVRNDGDSVLIGVPVTNTSDTTSGPVSVVFGAFNATLTLTNTYVDKGTYTTLSRTWDGFTLAPNETQTIYLKFTVADIDLTPITVSGTISGAVDGNDGSGTSVSITITKEEDGAKGKTYKAILNQTGTSAPTVTTLILNELSAAIVWAYTSEGVYTGTLVGAFTSDKTWWNFSLVGNPTGKIVRLARTSADVLTMSVFAADGTTPAELTGSLNLLVEVHP